MDQKIFQVDAFTSELYKGNPAAVCVLNNWLPDHCMQNIAMENNLSETAFLSENDQDGYDLRWFTPTVEVGLCGHATLAASHILYTEYGYQKDKIEFRTKSGSLEANKISHNKYLMDFPCDYPLPVEEYDSISLATGLDILECYKGKDDYLLILPDQKSVITATPDIKSMTSIPSRGVIISAPGDQKDFVSRCFFPNVGVDEDPVTGSAHTLLSTYWAHRLRKNRLHAQQLSQRSGDIECIYKGKRVGIIGEAITYLKGYIST